MACYLGRFQEKIKQDKPDAEGGVLSWPKPRFLFCFYVKLHPKRNEMHTVSSQSSFPSVHKHFTTQGKKFAIGKKIVRKFRQWVFTHLYVLQKILNT